eukprot:3359321-Rhodomonas_salina.1
MPWPVLTKFDVCGKLCGVVRSGEAKTDGFPSKFVPEMCFVIADFALSTESRAGSNLHTPPYAQRLRVPFSLLHFPYFHTPALSCHAMSGTDI